MQRGLSAYRSALLAGLFLFGVFSLSLAHSAFAAEDETGTMRTVTVTGNGNSAAEPDAEGAGERRFDHAGVGAGVRGRIRRPTARSAFGRGAADERRAARRPARGEPGRQPVRHVVEPSGRPPEPLGSGPSGARTSRPACSSPGRPADPAAGDRAPEQRRDHGVGGVLGHRFDAGAGQLGGTRARVGSRPTRCRIRAGPPAGRRRPADRR